MKTYDQPRQHIKKQRHYFANKDPSSQSYDFSSSQVWMLELEEKESWVLKNCCFWTMVLERLFKVPWIARRSTQWILKEISPEYSLEGLAEAEAPILWPPDAKNWLIWKDPDAGKDWWQEKGTREEEILESISGSVDLSLSKLWELVVDREVWRAAVRGVTKSQTRLSNWIELMRVTNFRARSLVLSAAEWKISDWYKTHSSLPRSF